MLGKLFDGFKTRLVAAFKSTASAECAICHEIILPGAYYTQIENNKYCYDCKPFKKVTDPRSLQTDPLFIAAPASLPTQVLDMTLYRVIQEQSMLEELHHPMQAFSYQERITEPADFSHVRELSPGATPRNITAIHFSGLPKDVIAEMQTAKLPRSRQRIPTDQRLA